MKLGMTEEGYELHFGVNYVGHALLAKLLIPVMQQTAERGGGHVLRTRIVIASSEGYAMAPKGGVAFDKLVTNCEDMVRISHGPSRSSFEFSIIFSR